MHAARSRFPPVCRQHALLYRVVVLLAPLTGTLLSRDYSYFLLSLFLLLEVQEGMCKKQGSRRRGHVHAGSLRSHRTHGHSSQELDKTLWEKSSLSRVFERISRISGTTSSFSHVSQRLGLKFSLAGWPAVAHTHPLAGWWAVLGRGASEGLSILLAGSHSFFAHAFPKATLTSEIHTSAALVSCHEE